MAGGCFTGAAPSRRGSWGSLLQHQPGQPCSQEAVSHHPRATHYQGGLAQAAVRNLQPHVGKSMGCVFFSHKGGSGAAFSFLGPEKWEFFVYSPRGCSSCSLFLVAHHQLPFLVPQQEPLCSCMTGSQCTVCKASQHHKRTDSW